PSVFAIANYLFFHLKHPEKSQEEILEMIAVDKVTQMQYRRMRQRTEAFSANCSLERLKRGGAIEDYHCSDAFDINAEGVVKLKESDTAFFRSHSKEEWDKRVQDIFTRTGTENS
ncbi:MAG: hypothetical protein ACRERV_07715, partial [Methylococcales bacterium]